MSIHRRVFLISLVHWLFATVFLAAYFFSFWEAKFEKLFFFLAGTTIVSWILFKGCPLLIWENKLRRKINRKEYKHFTLTAIPHNLFREFLNIRLPELATLYLIGILVVIKIVV